MVSDNKILVVILFIASFLTLNAEETKIFSYAEGPYFQYGFSRKQTYDVAICIDNPALTGLKIQSVSAYISTAEDIGTSSIWLSRELSLDGRVNVPDITSVEVIPVASTIDDMEVGILTVTFDEPYELDGKPIYVGYTIDVENISTQELKNPVLLSQGHNPDGLWIHSSSKVLNWSNYVKTGEGVASIYVTLAGDYPHCSLGLNYIDECYAKENEPFVVQAYLTNTGCDEIKSIEYSYSVKNMEGNGVVEFAHPIIPDISACVLVNLGCEPIQGIGSTPLELTITKVNGEPNVSMMSSGEVTVNVISYLPKKRPLVEEYTGTWCQYCSRGYIAMELLDEIYGDDLVLITYHYGDIMKVDYMPLDVSALFPGATIDRVAIIDPYYGTDENMTKDFYIRTDIEEALKQKAIADVQIVKAEIVDGILNVVTEAMFIKDIPDAFFEVDGSTYAKYRIGYSLMADGLTGTGSDWAQINGYSGLTGFEGTYLEPITEWPDVITGLVYNDVAVCTSEALIGANENVPVDIKAGEIITDSYSFNLKDCSLISDYNELELAVFIVDWESRYGEIINANKFSLRGLACVDDLTETDNIITTEYYNLSGSKVSNPSRGIYLQIDKLSDGGHKVSKIIKR